MKTVFSVAVSTALVLAVLVLLSSCTATSEDIARFPGTWESETESDKWTLEIDETSYEINTWTYPVLLIDLDWIYFFGIRGSYTASEQGLVFTIEEGSLGGETWFTQDSDPELWGILMSTLGGVTSLDMKYAISRTGNHLFLYSELFDEGGGAVVGERIAGEAVAASSYPDEAGVWEYLEGGEMWDTTADGSTLEMTRTIYFETDWHVLYGMRFDYTMNGDFLECTLTEAKELDGPWFTQASDPTAWSDFLADYLGGSDTVAILYGISPDGMNLFKNSELLNHLGDTIMFGKTGS
jgi:hypothetical protein